MAVLDDDHLSEQFYRWELRGRGWLLWDAPVLPEPPFRPFLSFTAAEPQFDPAVDDGRRQSVLSGAFTWLHQRLHRPFGTRVPPPAPTEEPLPDYWQYEQPPVELRLALPADLKVTPEVAEQCLLSLSAAHHPIAMEFLGLPEVIDVQLSCDGADQDMVQRQLVAHFPQSNCTPDAGGLERGWVAAGEEKIIAEFGLGREFMLPLITPSRGFSVDPLLGVLAALSDAGTGEVALLQILFHPTRHPWGQSILRSVVLGGEPLLIGGRDYIAGAKSKTERPLYAAVVRAAAKAGDHDRCIELVRGIAGALATLEDPAGNQLIPLDNEGYDREEHEQDLLQRRCRRSGMLLNSAELISLVHLPSASVQLPKLRQQQRRTRRAPQLVAHQPCLIGVNEHVGQVMQVGLNPGQRARHMQIIGASGTGKSTLLLNMIAQDLLTGDGVAVLDPHGDLVDAVLRLVPPQRLQDVILLDPADDEYPIGFNVLSAHSAMEKDLLASDLVAVFRRLATSWGDQMNAVLGNAILAILESELGGTLVDLRRFLVEMAYRKDYLRTVRDPEVVYYWTKEFPLLTGRPQGPVLTRLDTFLRPKPIRYMVAQQESRLDFGDILDSGKILLARLSHGAIGAENSYLLGTLLVSKLHQLALGRQRQREEQRRYFWLYIDEFHQFATPSMASILSGARKYRLGLILAHQELQQLENLPEVASAVSSNAYTRVCFRLSDQDAKKLEPAFGGFTAQDLQNLGTGEAIARVERADLSFNLRTTRPPAGDEEQANQIREEVVRLTRQRFAVPRSEVEAALNRARGGSPDEDIDSTSGVDKASGSPSTRRGGRRTASAPSPSSAASSAPEPLEANSQADIFEAPFAAASDVKSRSAPPPAVGPAAGRGGAQHQNLQRTIKQWAEGMGFKATIEGPVLGTRAADVALEREGLSIACELCVTTTFVHELGNIRKCLDAGFTRVAAISPDPDRLAKLREVVEPQLEEAELERVGFFTPDAFLALIQEADGSGQADEPTVRGYKVKTSYKSATAAEAAARQKQVKAVFDQAMRRLNPR